MKILLLEHPRHIEAERCNDIANTPLSSCLNSGYAAAVLQNSGHDVQIVEGYLDKLSYQQIMDVLTSYQPDILGVHMVYHWRPDTQLFGFLEQVKNAGITRYITAFGFYPTMSFQEILTACPALDSVIIGEHEHTFNDLANAVTSRTIPIPGSVPGIAARDSSGQITLTRRKLIADLDSLPFPVRTEAMSRIPEVNILGSRGCYGRCTFCYINSFYGQESCWRPRSPENIIAEVDAMIKKQNTRNFYFSDPNFFGPGQAGQKRARQLAALLKPRNIVFGVEGRVNDILDETIEALVDAGLRHILIGLESDRDSSLRRLNKMTTVAQNEEAIRILRKHGIEPNIGFIMFEPDSTVGDIRENLAFLKKNQLLSNLAITANVLYHHQIVLKGTPAFKQITAENRLKIQPDLTYEGEATFLNADVESLSSLMRQVTNCLFYFLNRIWSAAIPEPADAQMIYNQINGMLVQIFETNLASLEAANKIEDVVTQVTLFEQKINELLVFPESL